MTDVARVADGKIVEIWRGACRQAVTAPEDAFLLEFPDGAAVCGMRVVNGQLVEEG